MKRLSVLWAAVTLLVYPLTGAACDFSLTSLASLNASASDIFVGRVVVSPWARKADGSPTTTGADTLRFAVEKRFRGALGTEISLEKYGHGCTFPFLQGERYLVHARRVNGVLGSDYPDRPMLISEAAVALKYLEERAANRPIVWVAGSVSLTDAKADPLSSALTLELEGKGGRYQVKSPHGAFEIAVPPGEYKLWLEVNRKPVSDRITVELQSRRDAVMPPRDLRLNVGGVLRDAYIWLRSE